MPSASASRGRPRRELVGPGGVPGLAAEAERGGQPGAGARGVRAGAHPLRQLERQREALGGGAGARPARAGGRRSSRRPARAWRARPRRRPRSRGTASSAARPRPRARRHRAPRPRGRPSPSSAGSSCRAAGRRTRSRASTLQLCARVLGPAGLDVGPGEHRAPARQRADLADHLLRLRHQRAELVALVEDRDHLHAVVLRAAWARARCRAPRRARPTRASPPPPPRRPRSRPRAAPASRAGRRAAARCWYCCVSSAISRVAGDVLLGLVEPAQLEQRAQPPQVRLRRPEARPARLAQRDQLVGDRQPLLRAARAPARPLRRDQRRHERLGILEPPGDGHRRVGGAQHLLPRGRRA